MNNICEKSGTSHIEAVMLVKSETGDILSPIDAPETMVPTVIPRAVPMPKSATPMVPMVPKLDPVATDATDDKRRADQKK